MATFPSWISKKNRNNNSSQNLSPRQVANKAHSLAIKKLDRDDKRKKPQYSIRERLLLSKTMLKAEEVLNKKPTMYRSAVSFDDDDIMPPFKKSSALVAAEQPIVMASNQQKATTVKKEDEKALTTVDPAVESAIVVKPENQLVASGKNGSTLPTLEQMAAVSLVVVTVVASLKNINDRQQKSSIVSHDFCRTIMIPSHSSLTTII